MSLGWPGVEPGLALLAILLLAAVELAKAARWGVLFERHRPAYLLCLRALVAGQLTNTLAPVRAGELVRVGLLAAEGGRVIPAAASLAGVKAIDAVILGAIAASLVGRAALERGGASLLGVGLVGAAVVLLVLRGSALRRLLERHALARRFRLAALVDVAEALKDPRILLAVVVTTAVVWTAGLAANAVVLAAVGIEPTPELAARMLVAGYLVGLLPAPPGRLGVFETGVAAALASAGIGLGNAVAAGVVLHVGLLLELGLLLAGSLVARKGRRASA